MHKSFLSVFNAMVIAVLTFLIPNTPSPKTEEELLRNTPLFQQYEISDKLYVVDVSELDTDDEKHMLICLQGIVAKMEPSIYLKTNHTDSSYLAELEENGTEIIYTDTTGKNWTLELLVNKFKSYISDNGYVVYRHSDNAVGLNMATNLASLYGWLAVPESLEHIAVNAGLVKKEDYSDDNYNTFFQWQFFVKHKKEFNYNALIHENYTMKGLRDLAIQQKLFTFFVDDNSDGDFLRKIIMNYAGDNVPLIGWANDEVKYVSSVSKSGNFVIPADHCYNNSILASADCFQLTQNKKVVKKYTDDTKHYCAIVFSDGDNVQWIQNGFSEYYRKLLLETDFPMTWTVPPLLRGFSPITAEQIYDKSSENDYLIAGVSGAGYAHPSEYPYKALADFSDLTASAMLKSDLEYISVLDFTPENSIDEFMLTNSLEYFARYENIKGGVLYLDPIRYEGGKGKVYFVNDKPFVCTRFSLWHPSGNSLEVTKEWLDEQIDTVNNFSADINTINGYSIVNIHPWTISIENLEYFINGLDDDIVLVTVDELLTMIDENIPNITAEID